MSAKWETQLIQAKKQIDQGRMSEGFSLLTTVAESVEAQFGLNHPATATAFAELGNALLWRQNDKPAAKAHLEKAAAATTRLENKIPILGILSDLSLDFLLVDEGYKARDLLQRAYQIFLAAPDRELHLRGAKTRSAVSAFLLTLNVLGRHGQIVAAADKYLVTIAKRKKLADLAADELQLFGLTCRRAFKFDLARELFGRAAELLENARRPEDEDFGAALLAVADRLEGVGKIEETLLLYRLALTVQEEVFGAQYPTTLVTTTQLVQKYILHTLPDKAKELVERAKSKEFRYLPDHPEKAAFFNYMGYYARILGEHDTAQLLLSQAVRMMERMYGWDNAKLAPALLNLARVYQHQNRYLSAMRHLERALTLQLSDKQADPEMLLETFEWLAAAIWWEESALAVSIHKMTAFEQREYVQAGRIESKVRAHIKRLEEFYRGVSNKLKQHGPIDPDLQFKLMMIMGDFYIHYQKIGKAETIFQKLGKATARDREGSPFNRVIVESRLGQIYRAKRVLDKAEDLISSAIQNAQQFPDNEQAPFYIADNYRELGRIMIARDNFNNALEYFNIAVDCYRKLDAGPSVEKTLEEMAEISQKMGRHDAARKIMRQLRAAREARHGK